MTCTDPNGIGRVTIGEIPAVINDNPGTVRIALSVDGIRVDVVLGGLLEGTAFSAVEFHKGQPLTGDARALHRKIGEECFKFLNVLRRLADSMEGREQ